MLALNVYSAMCYHKLDYYDVSQEMLATYVQMHPDSIMATNLKACNNYRLYSGKAAEAELKQLMDQLSSNYVFGQEIIKHNLVIFRNGDGALQVLPGLIGIIPEAKLNLAIYHLKHGNYDAFHLHGVCTGTFKWCLDDAFIILAFPFVKIPNIIPWTRI